MSTNNPAGVSVALYLCSPRLGRGFSASGRVEHAAEVLPDAVASAAKRAEASPLASPTMAAREACETGNEQRAGINVCCALPPLSTRLSPWSSTSQGVSSTARRCCPTRLHRRRGDFHSPLQRWQREAHQQTGKEQQPKRQWLLLFCQNIRATCRVESFK